MPVERPKPRSSSAPFRIAPLDRGGHELFGIIDSNGVVWDSNASRETLVLQCKNLNFAYQRGWNAARNESKKTA